MPRDGQTPVRPRPSSLSTDSHSFIVRSPRRDMQRKIISCARVKKYACPFAGSVLLSETDQFQFSHYRMKCTYGGVVL